jgi:hypothetical protein
MMQHYSMMVDARSMVNVRRVDGTGDGGMCRGDRVPDGRDGYRGRNDPQVERFEHRSMAMLLPHGQAPGCFS